MESGNSVDLPPGRRKPNRWGPRPSKTDEEVVKKPRKSRFSSDQSAPPPVIPAQPPKPTTVTPQILQQTVLMQMRLKLINDRITNVVQDAIARDKNPDRSPSPPPRYDALGKRINTTEVWMRENLMQERNELIEEMLRINSFYVAPMDYIKPKPSRQLRIPQKEFPNYNFIGLIIGPRGNTQKRMELETGTKISIRGKGSVKEGSKGRANKSTDDHEELHVHITGDDEAKVILAAKMVEELLCPVDDDKNEHKLKQLKELALINGTVREDEFCPECGERGHRQFECPQRIKTFKNAGVKCSICGDMSHPTRDCPLKERAPSNEVSIDHEYDNFMSELGGKAKESTVVTATTAAIAPKKTQTVVHLGSVMTGLPPQTAAAYPATPMYGAPWMAAAPPVYGYPPVAPYAGYVAPPPMPGIPPPPMLATAAYSSYVPVPVPPPEPRLPPPPEPQEKAAPGQQYSSINEMD